MWQGNRVLKTLFVLCVLTSAVPAFAGGGEVLPASAQAKGYSLSSIAIATAAYNTGQQAGNPLTPPPPDVPFQVLVGDCTVKPGTMIYLPVFVADDSGGAPAGFPADITNQRADAQYLSNLVLTGFGVEAFIVQVDGRTSVLTNNYITGTTTPPLLDGVPAGTHYIVSAAVLTSLTPGKHTVSLGGIIAGIPVAFLSYTVIVR